MAVITNSLITADLRTATALDRGLYELLYDRASLRNLGVVSYRGEVNASGAPAKVIRQYGAGGYTAMSATLAEDTDVTSTNPTTASVTITVARAALMFEMTDFANLTGFGDDLDPLLLADSMVAAFDSYFSASVCTAAAAATTDVSPGVGVDLDLDTFMTAIYTLEQANSPMPLSSVLAPVQVSDLQESLRGAAGSISMMPATADMLRAAPQGFVGQLLGVNVIKSDYVPTAAAQREGSMFSPDALGWVAGIPKAPLGAVGFRSYADVPILVEFQRDSSKAVTEIIGNAYMGTSILEQARIVSITSDA